MWRNTRKDPPPANTVVEVLHSDNQTVSKLFWDGKMFWTPDKAMYVYFFPEKWRVI